MWEPQHFKDRREKSKQDYFDRRLTSKWGMRDEIHRRWPYEIWVRNPAPNPEGEYTFFIRKSTEDQAIKVAKKIQAERKRKALVFFHPSPDSERVMIWNDTTFDKESTDADTASQQSDVQRLADSGNNSAG